MKEKKISYCTHTVDIFQRSLHTAGCCARCVQCDQETAIKCSHWDTENG